MYKQPIRVLQILPALHVGGVERGTLDWALELKRLGHVPIVISAGGYGVECLLDNNIQHISLPVGKKALSSFLLVRKLRQLFEELEVDVVHARSRLPAWLSYWAIKKMDKKPLFVTTLHGLHTVSPYASVMAKGDAVIAVSQTAKDYLLQNFSKYLKSDPLLVYRGLDAGEFPYGFKADKEWLAEKKTGHPLLFENKKVLLPGRLSEIKGAMGLIPWLKKADKNISLLVNAKPGESKFSRKFAAELEAKGVASRVEWLGIERDMKQLYSWVDVVLSVNKKPESFGRTVLEALTVGCPAIAFNQGGVSEVMMQLFPQGLITVDDWEGLSLKIKQILEQKPVVHQHDKFSSKVQFEETMAVYQSHMNPQKLNQK